MGTAYWVLVVQSITSSPRYLHISMLKKGLVAAGSWTCFPGRLHESRFRRLHKSRLIASPIERESERLQYQDLQVKNACGISAQK